MAASGVKVADDIQEEYNNIKMEKLHAYLVLAIEDKKMIKIVEKGEPYPGGKNAAVDEAVSRQAFDELKEKVKAMMTPCYILFDARMDKKGGGSLEKLVFYAWSPDDKSSIKEKMLYSSSKDGLTKKLEGLALKFQANALDELDFDEIKAKSNK